MHNFTFTDVAVFLSKCVKWSVFSIKQDFASTDVDALISIRSAFAKALAMGCKKKHILPFKHYFIYFINLFNNTLNISNFIFIYNIIK